MATNNSTFCVIRLLSALLRFLSYNFRRSVLRCRKTKSESNGFFLCSLRFRIQVHVLKKVQVLNPQVRTTLYLADDTGKIRALGFGAGVARFCEEVEPLTVRIAAYRRRAVLLRQKSYRL